tara:strand:- start:75 stop:518 length:444 start_codon:yes stop_codon:yes gene_type:complete
MAVIKPTLTLTSNASTAGTDPGPLSVALSLSATDSLTVDSVKAATLAVSATEATLFDGSAEGTAGTGGTVGGFVYLKNTSTTAARLVHIGIVADDGSAADLVQSGDVARLFTLKVGEFAFFPFDYTMDITVDADGAGTLEYWLFDRG